MGRLKVKAPKAAAFNPAASQRTAPVHDRRGPVCNVGEGCRKLAHYVHGKWAGCDTPEHKEKVFTMCRKVRRAEKVVLPDVDFEPEDSLREAAELAEKIG